MPPSIATIAAFATIITISTLPLPPSPGPPPSRTAAVTAFAVEPRPAANADTQMR